MQYTSLSTAGLKVSRICLGCMSFGDDASWKIGPDESRRLVERAVDVGINFFDTANSYSRGRSEEILGACIKGRREDVVIATKVGLPVSEAPDDRGLSRGHILQQINASLKRLQTDHVDLYQIHRWDYDTSIEETMKTMNEVVCKGMAHYIGASSMFAWQFLKSLYTSERLGLERFVSMQIHYNLIYREEEREMIPLCREECIAILPWSPLARGFLTGKYKRGKTPMSPRYESDGRLAERYFKPEDFDVVETLELLAKEKSLTPAQVAIAWLLHKNVTALIVGATKPQHIEDAVAALELKLDTEDMRRLENPYRAHQVIGHK